MSLADLTGTCFGPYPYRTSTEKVGEYIAATGDDPHRWAEAAPPALAGAMLFEVAPHLLTHPEAVDQAASVVHGDQQFTWHRPIPLERQLEISGTVERARERGGVWFVSFELEVRDTEGAVVTGTSTFLMSGADGPAVTASVPEAEPAPDQGSVDETGAGGDVRSASRADLIRYAGASRDWNPIHWDHEAAVAAGLSGVVVHGLLQSAWLTVAAARAVPGLQPFDSAKFRYRAPLRPAVVTTVDVTAADGRIDATLAAGETVFVTGAFQRHE